MPNTSKQPGHDNLVRATGAPPNAAKPAAKAQNAEPIVRPAGFALRCNPGNCDRCGRGVTHQQCTWHAVELGDFSLAYADCGCGRGTALQAIRRRANRTSRDWARTVMARARQMLRPTLMGHRTRPLVTEAY